MPWPKGTLHSTETRAKLRKNHNRLGCYHSEKTKIRLSQLRVGKPLSEEHKKSISEGVRRAFADPDCGIHRGGTRGKQLKPRTTPPWNKGLTKDTDHRLEKLSKKRKEQWSDPDFKARASAGIKKRCNLPEQKIKIRERMKERSNRPEVREYYRKLALERWNNPSFRASLSQENANNWKGGISFEQYPYDFKLIVARIRQRDKNQCQICKIKQSNYFQMLSVHH